MKRAIACLLSILLILSVFAVPVMADEATETIEENGFVCERLRDGNLKLVQYKGDDTTGTVNIPSTIAGSHIEQIGEYVFDGCHMTNVTIPDTVRMIDRFAFNNCTGIRKITIPNSVMFINGNPFTGCTGLVNISLDPEHPTLQVTSDGVLYSKRNKMLLCYPCSKTDQSYSIKSGTLTIGSHAFHGCSKLESINIAATVSGIGEGAFFDCAKLTDITLPDSLLSIDALAFAGCRSLKGVSIPWSISRIETATFFGCSSLANVSFPASLLTICDRAFYKCEGLREIRFPTSLTEIGDDAFYGCSSLVAAYIPVMVTKIGKNAFENCSVQLYMHVDEYSFAELYAKLNVLSYTHGNQDSFLTEDGF